MDLDRLALSIASGSSRRAVLPGLGATLLASITGIHPTDSLARGRGKIKKHNRKKKNKKKNARKNQRNPKLPFNAFGCLDVGRQCRGDDDLCCSGICDGKRPKKGHRDKSQCVAHNEGGCTPQRSFCAVDVLDEARCNLQELLDVCLTTTGNAGFCTNILAFNAAANCRLCSRDTDCLAFGFPPGSACVLIQPLAGGVGCGNDFCAATERRACVAPVA